jgi:uncharacterized membrane protein YfcA
VVLDVPVLLLLFAVALAAGVLSGVVGTGSSIILLPRDPVASRRA